MAKILIVSLPWLKSDGVPHKYSAREGMRWSYTTEKEPIISFRPFPFFMAYTSALLKRTGHDVHIIDCLTENVSYDDLIQVVKQLKYDYLLAETHTPSYNNDKQIIKALKYASPNTRIVLTGQHVTALPDEVLAENIGIVDHVLVGEYEVIADKLINCNITEQKIGMDMLIKNKILSSYPNIDQCPWPDRKAFNILNYNETFCANYPNVHILNSRGCPYGCGFCNCFLMTNGRKARYRNPYDVVEEMKYCIRQFKPKEFWFEDDNINANEQKFKKLMTILYEANLQIPFRAMGHISISNSALELFRMAGGTGLKFGIESIDDNVLARLRKGITYKMILKTLENCKQLGIETHLTYCIGLPGDTKESITNTIQFAKHHGTSYQISLAAPFPGTPLYDEAKKEGWLNMTSWDDFDGMNDAILSYPNLSSKTIYALYQQGQESSYRKILLSGQWKKYLRMIYQERGIKGVFSLIKRKDIIKSLIFGG